MVITSIKRQLLRWPWLIPVGIVLLAFVVRLVGNTITPPSPYWEEAAIGYDAYAVLKTGSDHRGQLFPLVAFTSFADYKPSLYFYLTIPSIAVFGLSTWAVRFPAVVASSLTVALTYLLVARWSNRRTAGWAALLLALQPWSWQIGRVGFEVNSSVTLLMLGIYAFERSTDQSATRGWRWLSALSFGLSMYAYHAARLLAPLFAISLWFIHLATEKLKTARSPLSLVKVVWSALQPWLVSGILAVIIIAPILGAARTKVVQQRFAETSIFSQLTPIQESNTRRALSHNDPLGRLTEHRWIWWGRTLWDSYISHFDPGYLFAKGDINPRHSSQYLGMLYPWELITIVAGLVFIVKSWKKCHQTKLIIFTLLSPFAAMITVATPHSLRALPLSVWLAIWSGIGLSGLIDLVRPIKFSKYWSVCLAGLVITASFVILQIWMWGPYRLRQSREWQYGYQELYQSLRQFQQTGEKIYVAKNNGRPAMYLWFYEKTNPLAVQKFMSTIPLNQAEPATYAEFTFEDGVSGSRGLHAITIDELPTNAQLLKRINYLDGTLAWLIYRQE